jgi:hypothetical protein
VKLYHFSENPDIQKFEPRLIYKETEAKVWTIDEYHAPHYYFPRECPRVCIWPKEDTSAEDLELFFGMSITHRMIAIESAWYERVSKGHIYRYSFDPIDFEIHEPNAGYYISTQCVEPINVERMDDLVGSIVTHGIELRVTPSLKPLREFILKSSINFSMIRMRNAVIE